MGPVEVITSVERRRHWSAAAEAGNGGRSGAARQEHISGCQEIRHPSQSAIQVEKALNRGPLLPSAGKNPSFPASEVKHFKAQIRELERLLGKKTMEVEILKDAIEIAREKKLISRGPLPKKDDIP